MQLCTAIFLKLEVNVFFLEVVEHLQNVVIENKPGSCFAFVVIFNEQSSKITVERSTIIET